MIYRKYLTIFFAVIVLIALPCCLNALFLFFSGEFISVERVAKMQHEGRIELTAFATHDLTYPYKLAIYQLIKPSIIAIGSSRVMPFRQKMFRQPFLNLSRAMNSVEQGSMLINEILAIHKPQVVIIGVDFWWFVGHAPENINLYTPPKDRSNISIKLLLAPFLWLYQDKIAIQHYVNTLFQPFKANSRNLGVTAQIRNEGFARDGSYYHTGDITGLYPSHDVKFHSTFSQIKESKGFFAHDMKLNHLSINRFIEMITYLNKQGIQTYVFIPPLAPSVIHLMSEYQSQFKYINELLFIFSKNNINFFNFHDPRTLNTNNCEFLDGFHGGEVTYMKLLHQMAKKDPSNLLSQYLDSDYINYALVQYHDLVMIPDKQITRMVEVDHLQLGCRK